MKIPHSFQVDPIAAPTVRKVNSQTMKANAIQEHAQQGLAAGVNAAVQTGNEIYQSHIEKQYNTDMIAGGAMLDQFKFQRDSEIKKIPVDSSVDYDAETKRINQKFDTMWTGYSKKNIRNQNHPTVKEARQRSIDAFALDGATTSARLGVQYEDARNLNNIEMAEGIKAGQLKQDPYNANTVAELQQFQDARLALGVISQAESISNKAAIQTKAYELADGQTMLAAGNLAYRGNFEAAGDLIDNRLSPEYSKEERTKEKDKIFGAGTYNRLKDTAQETKTVEGWDVVAKELKDDSHMSVGQKSGIRQQISKGRSDIDRGQNAELKRDFADAAKGNLDLTEIEIKKADTSKSGLSTVLTPKVEQVLINTARLYESEQQVVEDGKLFKDATGKNGIKAAQNLNEDIFEASQGGTMTAQKLDEMLKELKSVKSDMAPGVYRQFEREINGAFTDSLSPTLGQGSMRRAGLSGRVTFGGYNEGQIAVYDDFEKALFDQNKSLGNYIDLGENRAWAEAEIAQFGRDFKEPTSKEISELSKKLTDKVKKMTRIEERTRNNQ